MQSIVWKDSSHVACYVSSGTLNPSHSPTLVKRIILRYRLSLIQDHQWRRQSWDTGARAPWSLRMHANFAAVQTMAVLIFLPSSVSSKLDRQIHQNPESNFYLILP